MINHHILHLMRAAGLAACLAAVAGAAAGAAAPTEEAPDVRAANSAATSPPVADKLTPAEAEVRKACQSAITAALPGAEVKPHTVLVELNSGNGESKDQRPTARCTVRQAQTELAKTYFVWIRTADLYVLRVAQLDDVGERVLYMSPTGEK